MEFKGEIKKEIKRLDLLLVERGMAASLEMARALILAGSVFSEEKRLDKSGHAYLTEIPIRIQSRTPEFVSRGGFKLAHALKEFGINPKSRVCLDIGSSTGGFTDCLLKNGATHVFSCDVGYGLIDQKLRKDPRVTVVERSNARWLKMSDLSNISIANSNRPGQISLGVIDVSFISLATIVPSLQQEFSLPEWVILFKPQFEVEQKFVLKGGIVKNLEAIECSLAAMEEVLRISGLKLIHPPIKSPIVGKKSGNVEYLLHCKSFAP